MLWVLKLWRYIDREKCSLWKKYPIRSKYIARLTLMSCLLEVNWGIHSIHFYLWLTWIQSVVLIKQALDYTTTCERVAINTQSIRVHINAQFPVDQNHKRSPLLKTYFCLLWSFSNVSVFVLNRMHWLWFEKRTDTLDIILCFNWRMNIHRGGNLGFKSLRISFGLQVMQYLLQIQVSE